MNFFYISGFRNMNNIYGVFAICITQFELDEILLDLCRSCKKGIIQDVSFIRVGDYVETRHFVGFLFFYKRYFVYFKRPP